MVFIEIVFVFLLVIIVWLVFKVFGGIFVIGFVIGFMLVFLIFFNVYFVVDLLNEIEVIMVFGFIFIVGC